MKRPEGSLISYFSHRVKKEGGINLAQGTPGFSPPPPLLAFLKKIAVDKSYDFMKKAVTLLGFDVKEGRGGYFLWAKLPPPHTDTFTVALELYNNVPVAVVPGENFSRSKNNYIRVNIGTGMPVIREAVLRIKGFFI